MTDVAVIIVTRNRIALLLECLQATRTQRQPPDAWYVINNASTDDTVVRLVAEGWTQDPRFHLITLDVNIGGAGGFHRGLAEASAAGHHWLWVMDDDCIPQPTALSELLDAFARFPAAIAPKLLCSRVEWVDGSIHPLNVVAVNGSDKEYLYRAASCHALSIRACTFVSVLVQRSMVETYGLPNAVYFLWMDDVEWTARVLRREHGVLVPASVVTHRTEFAHSTLEAPASRFYFYVRNCLWTLLGSTCFSPREKCHRGMVMVYVSLCWLARRWWLPSAWSAIIRATVRGLLPPIRAFDRGSRMRSPSDGAARH
jgi:rhamnopyranosyl-N-acetylglucosaminyl-diphospho-decaprenol beta-1,3/1,4-galactofuranosyltransferase